MAVTFAPGGNSLSFSKLKFPEDLPEYLGKLGLNGYEYECGRGIKIADKTFAMLPGLAEKNNIKLTLHAPYFISLSSTEEEKRKNSVWYILESAKAAKKLGAEKIVVHSGSCSKMSRKTALELAKQTLSAAQRELDENGLADIIICPETMGKINQLGTLKEVIELCKTDDRMLPCIDFGHLNARDCGAIRTADDYRKILETVENELGYERLSRMHVHFSKIMYTEGGEKKHLTFADTEYGPEYEPLMELIARKKLQSVTIVCESDGTQAEDAAAMKKVYEKYLL